MAAVVSSKKQKSKDQNKKQIELNHYAEQFSAKMNNILEQSQKGLKQLLLDLDNIILSDDQNCDNQQTQNDNKQNNIDLKESKIIIQTNNNQFDDQSIRNSQISAPKKLKIGQLNKVKQKLMDQLRLVDKQLLQSKFKQEPIVQLRSFQNSTNDSSLMKSPKNQTNSKVVLKPIKKADRPFQNRTLQIMQELNLEKIKKHEQLINRMKKRQDEEIKKIQELEQKRIKIQLQKNRTLGQKKQNTTIRYKKQQAKKIR